jgi:DNA-binding transcriptional MocR family regulator
MSDHPALSTRVAALRSSAVRDLLRDAHRPGMLSLAGGLPAPELFDVDGLRAASEATFAEVGRSALQYGVTEGQPALREALACWLGERGVSAAPDELVVTGGSQQALDLIARATLDPGDPVGVEAPGYLAALQAFALAGARLVPAAVDGQGACIDDWMTAERPPRVVYVVSNFGNPSGASLALDRRIALLRWAAARHVLVVEDDPYGELRVRGERLPSLHELARGIPGAAACCAYVSSLSKVVSPGLRIGFAVLPAWLLEGVARAKQAVDLHTSTLGQEIAARYLRSGRLADHLPRIRATYRDRLQALCDALRSTFGERIALTEPDGGMFVWARLCDGTDTARLLPFARERGMIFVPGTAFDPEGRPSAWLRLSFATTTPAGLREAVERLARAHGDLELQATKEIPSEQVVSEVG